MRTRALVILGASSLAIVQPLLDLFGSNPEFFVAGRYSAGQIVMFALLIMSVPPLIGIALTEGAMAVNATLGRIVYGGVVGVFAVAFMLALLRQIGLDALAVVALVAVVAGVGIAVAVIKTRGGTLFASYLAAANVLFVGMFLFIGPTSELVIGSGNLDLGDVDMPALEGPVVWIVLDEMPATTFMRADGSINEDRYPGFAELASVSTWYRNASSPYNLTHRAVPAQLDGRLADDGDLPVAADHPRNLFTLLGGPDVPVVRYESVTDLCPASVCEPAPRQSLSRALEDASVVYGHRVLPASLRDELPAIDNSWGAYGAEDDTGSTGSDDVGGGADDDDGDGGTLTDRAYEKWRELGADERSPFGQAGILREQIAAIGPEPSVHFAHVAIPHRPWTLAASGISASSVPELITDPDAPGYEWRVQLDFQLHSMQLGAADVLMSELVDHLRSLPTWEETTLVVTSDHGTNLTPPDIGRMKPTDANREEVYRVPLFIKAPGQVAGEVSDVSAQTLDILPTLIDLLGGETDWEFDGHSLVDGSEPRTEPPVSTDVQPAIDIAARRAEQFHFGDDWSALGAVGENGDLVGHAVEDLTVGGPSAFQVRLDAEDLFADLPTGTGTAPFVLAGHVTGGDEPPETALVAAVNGQLVGVVGGYRPSGVGWDVDGFVGDVYREGANTVDLYEVSRSAAGAPTLHLVG